MKIANYHYSHVVAATRHWLESTRVREYHLLILKDSCCDFLHIIQMLSEPLVRDTAIVTPVYRHLLRFRVMCFCDPSSAFLNTSVCYIFVSNGQSSFLTVPHSSTFEADLELSGLVHPTFQPHLALLLQPAALQNYQYTQITS